MTSSVTTYCPHTYKFIENPFSNGANISVRLGACFFARQRDAIGCAVETNYVDNPIHHFYKEMTATIHLNQLTVEQLNRGHLTINVTYVRHGEHSHGVEQCEISFFEALSQHPRAKQYQVEQLQTLFSHPQEGATSTTCRDMRLLFVEQLQLGAQQLKRLHTEIQIMEVFREKIKDATDRPDPILPALRGPNSLFPFDCVFYIGPERKEVHAHRSVLSKHCSNFFQGLENWQGRDRSAMPLEDPAIVQHLIDYLYEGRHAIPRDPAILIKLRELAVLVCCKLPLVEEIDSLLRASLINELDPSYLTKEYIDTRLSQSFTKEGDGLQNLFEEYLSLVEEMQMCQKRLALDGTFTLERDERDCTLITKTRII